MFFAVRGKALAVPASFLSVQQLLHLFAKFTFAPTSTAAPYTPTSTAAPSIDEYMCKAQLQGAM